MGNCFTAKNLENPGPFSSQLRRGSNPDQKGSVYKVESTKRKVTEDFNEEEKKQVDEKNLKRNEKRGNFKIKKGGDKENEPIYEHFQKVDKNKGLADIKFISASLKTHFVFYSLNEIDREQIVKAMFYCEINAEEYLFKQGDDASCYFILETGKLELSINNEVKKVLGSGEGFGELALLYSAPRSATIRALEKCSLWAIDRSTFRSVVEEIMTKEYSENRKFIEAVPFFSHLFAN